MTSIPRLRAESANTQRPSLSRSSTSSATLFFGPSIPQADGSHRLDSTASKISIDSARMNLDPPVLSNAAHLNRHSYAGSTTSAWNLARSPPRRRSEEDDEAEFFLGGPPDSSFAFALIGDTPSPKKKQRTDPIEMLPKKFIYGFEQTGAFFAFYNSVPNNSLPVLWHDQGEWQALLPASKTLP